jgi:hypothetical protein
MLRSVDNAQLFQLAEIFISRINLIMARTFDEDTNYNDLMRKKYSKTETEIYQLCRKVMVEYNDWKIDSSFAKPNKYLIKNNIKGFGKAFQ